MVGELPVWSIDGRWKPHVLANLLPDQKDAILAGQEERLSQAPNGLLDYGSSSGLDALAGMCLV